MLYACLTGIRPKVCFFVLGPHMAVLSEVALLSLLQWFKAFLLTSPPSFEYFFVSYMLFPSVSSFFPSSGCCTNFNVTRNNSTVESFHLNFVEENKGIKCLFCRYSQRNQWKKLRYRVPTGASSYKKTSM